MHEVLQLFRWSERIAVGDAIIDQEHQALYRLAGQLHEAMLSGEAKSRLATLFQELVRYTDTHFQHEEELMRKCGYPGYAAHASEHGKLRMKVTRLLRRFEAGEDTITIEFMLFLDAWLQEHISVSDRRIASFRANRA